MVLPLHVSQLLISLVRCHFNYDFIYLMIQIIDKLGSVVVSFSHVSLNYHTFSYVRWIKKSISRNVFHE
jgi:hypothetical protein